MAFKTANTAPTSILSCAAASKCLSHDALTYVPFVPERWKGEAIPLGTRNNRNSRWQVSLAPGSASWSPPPKNQRTDIINLK